MAGKSRVERALKQGFIYVVDIDKEIVKLEVSESNCDRALKRFVAVSNGCLVLSIYFNNYAKKRWLSWALSEGELK